MPKNKRGGKKSKRSKNVGDAPSRVLLLKEEGQEYAMVTKILGGSRVSTFCTDGKNRIALIRGKMHKKVWITKDDFVLLGLRDFQDDKADVIHKYQPDEVRHLKTMGEIPSSMISHENDEDGSAIIDEEEVGFDFKDI